MGSKLVRHPAFPYCFPFFLCIIFVISRDAHPLAVYLLYPLQTLAVGASILWLWSRLPSLKPSKPFLSALLGIVAVMVWIGLDRLWIKHETGIGFNPWRFDSVVLGCLLLFFRVSGPTLVVPIMEEIFWRGFLMRYLIKEDFENVKLGTYSHLSFIVTTGMFALIHGSQWPLGVAVGLLYGGWFVYSKNLGNVILAHGMTNLLLGVYVIKTESWWFW